MQMGHLDELMLSLAWKLTLQASGGSDTPSSYTQTRSVHARRIYA